MYNPNFDLEINQIPYYIPNMENPTEVLGQDKENLLTSPSTSLVYHNFDDYSHETPMYSSQSHEGHVGISNNNYVNKATDESTGNFLDLSNNPLRKKKNLQIQTKDSDSEIPTAGELKN